MAGFKDEYLLSRQEYGELFPYVSDDEVSSVFWNGKMLWITEIHGGSYPAKEVLEKDFIDKFVLLVCNRAGMRLGVATPIIHYVSHSLDFTFVHRSLSPMGTSFILKKKSVPKRPEPKEMMERGICTEDDLEQLEDAIKSQRSLVIVGAGVSDRTEILRFLSRYTRPECRTVVIDSGVGLDLLSLTPGKDIIELTVDCRKDVVSLTELAIDLDAAIIVYPELKADKLKAIQEELPGEICIITSMNCRDMSIAQRNYGIADILEIGVELISDRSGSNSPINSPDYTINRIIDLQNTVYSEKVMS